MPKLLIITLLVAGYLNWIGLVNAQSSDPGTCSFIFSPLPQVDNKCNAGFTPTTEKSQNQKTPECKCKPAGSGGIVTTSSAQTPSSLQGGKASGTGQLCDNDTGIHTAIGCIHTNPAGLAKDILKLATGIGGGMAFLLMVLGAFRMITSQGNPENLKTGRETFINAIIGLLFVVFSVLLMQIIGVNILGLPGFG